MVGINSTTTGQGVPPASSFHDPFPFPDVRQLIDERSGLFGRQRLHQPAGPADLHAVHSAGCADPKVQPRGALAGVTVAAIHLAEVGLSSGG